MAIAVLSFSKHTDLSVGICCLGLGRSPWLAFFGKVLCVADPGGTGGTLIAVLAVVVALVPRDCRPLLRRRTGVSASATHLHQAQRQLSCIASELTSSSLSLHS